MSEEQRKAYAMARWKKTVAKREADEALRAAGELGFSMSETDEVRKIVWRSFEELASSRASGKIPRSELIRACSDPEQIAEGLIAFASTESEKMRSQVLADRLTDLGEDCRKHLVAIARTVFPDDSYDV